MTVPAGYKVTEVGVIPGEWNATLLDTIAKRGSGHTPDKKCPHYWHGNIPWVSLKDSAALDRGYIFETTDYVTSAGIANSSAVEHPAGSVVLSRDAGVGKSAILGMPMAVSQHFMAWQCSAALDRTFLYYVLQSRKPEFERIAMGNTIKTIGLPYFRQFRIPVPPLPEQKAIATALNDVDALITALEQLLAKKRDLKQAAMQRLLTGKERLPGFGGGEWNVQKFGTLAAPRRDRVDPRRTKGHDFCVELEHIRSDSGRIVGNGVAGMEASLKSMFRPGDVLFGKLRAYLRKYWHADREGVCSTEIWVLASDLTAIMPRYLFQLVQTSKFVEAASTAYGTHMPRADWNVVKNLEVRVPPLPEQTAIATVLADMDADLATLETRLTKTRALKAGMMQELLTGRIRLI